MQPVYDLLLHILADFGVDRGAVSVSRRPHAITIVTVNNFTTSMLYGNQVLQLHEHLFR